MLGTPSHLPGRGLLDGGRPAFVLDAKYKLAPDRADVYQVLAYAHALGVQRAALVHPVGEDVPRGRLRIKDPGEVEVTYLALDLSRDPEEIEKSSSELAARVGALLPAHLQV